MKSGSELAGRRGSRRSSRGASRGQRPRAVDSELPVGNDSCVTSYAPFHGGGADALSTAPRRLDQMRSALRDEPGFVARFDARTAPSLLRRARAIVEKRASLELHVAGTPSITRVPREDVAGWVALMLLGALPQPEGDAPLVDASPLLLADWPSERAKLRCMLAMFDRAADATLPGSFEVERVVVPERAADAWATDTRPLLPLVVDRDGAIEAQALHRQADFANRYLGGGVLHGGCVQEEIRFSVSPELLFGLIVSPRMEDGEAIVLRGAERFASTRGYAGKLAFDRDFVDDAPRTADGAPDVEVVAFDAIDYRKRDAGAQFTQDAMLRELRKVSAATRADARQLPFATGNWGCGVFRGDPQLKALLQWLAASAEGRALRYHPFGDARVDRLEEVAKRWTGRTVGDLFRHVSRTTAEGDAFRDEDLRDRGRAFWRGRWDAGQIGFHEGKPNAYLERHADRFLNGARRVFVPLAGKSVDLRFLAERGLEVVGCEIIESAARAFFDEAGAVPVESRRGAFLALEAPIGAGRVTMLVGDALDLEAATVGPIDALFDRAALVAMDPKLRDDYVAATTKLLSKGGRVLLVSLEHDAGVGPPHAVTESDVSALYASTIDVELLEREDIASTSAHILAKGATYVREVAYLGSRR